MMIIYIYHNDGKRSSIPVAPSSNCPTQAAEALYPALVCHSCPRGTVCLHQLFTDFISPHVSNPSIWLMLLSRVTYNQSGVRNVTI